MTDLALGLETTPMTSGKISIFHFEGCKVQCLHRDRPVVVKRISEYFWTKFGGEKIKFPRETKNFVKI